MRHRASLLASMEGTSRAAFLIARELLQNTRSGLTPRFLSKKLDLPIEEIEYLVDVNHKLLYTDITKIRLAPEGVGAVKRITEGLESHGDAAAFTQRVRNMSNQDMQRFEERLGLERSLPKKELIECGLERLYSTPEAILNYVASRDFSSIAREVFDIVWQSKDGILSVSQVYALHGGSEFEVEQALWELFQGCACFELFRFDSEDRLVRAVALLKEIREYRRNGDGQHAQERLRSVKGALECVSAAELTLSDAICRIVAAVAARPIRLRNDGELFREDRRRLEEVRTEEDEPSLNACLWAAEGLGWLVRVDNVLRAGKIDGIVGMSRLELHQLVYICLKY